MNVYLSLSNIGLRSRHKLCETAHRHLSTTSMLCHNKEKIVILGSGWGGFRLAKDLDKNQFDVTVVSPRNHFVFTPLLPSTSVGTLEFRCVQEPVRNISELHYHQANARKIDFEKQEVTCTDLYMHYKNGDWEEVDFLVPYDKLVISVGVKSNTFGTPGIVSLEEERSSTNWHDRIGTTGTNKYNVFFLKQLEHARAIRNRVLECFERASNPFITTQEGDRILTFVVVGGGPIAIEFASELCEFLRQDVSKRYHDLQGRYKVVIIEPSNQLLRSFDSSLSRYAMRSLASKNVILKTGHYVKEVNDISVVLGSGEEIPFGLCVWSTGNARTDFVYSLDVPRTADHRIQIDDKLKVIGKQNVFAMGDCAANQKKPLATLAQVANQQGSYLAKCFNNNDTEINFEYKFLGSMASLGTFEAIADLGPILPGSAGKVKGLIASLTWRSAYWTKSVSVTNKILVLMYWLKQHFLGRDISKF